MYSLQKYKGQRTKHICPQCEVQNKFTLYVDENEMPLNNLVGRCDREQKCGYHYPPKAFFQNNPTYENNTQQFAKPKPIISKPISYMDKSILTVSVDNNLQNNFRDFMYQKFGKKSTDLAFSRYSIGTSDHWKGATIFWQIDSLNRIRTGKVMLYGIDGKRVKKPRAFIQWMHKVKQLKNFNLEQCFFGEHLLRNNDRPVAICESEKTAIIMSICFTNLIWLATGGLSNLNEKNLLKLKDRKVVLFPDNGCFEKWNSKISQIRNPNISISSLLESSSINNDLSSGYDLADWVLGYN